MIPPVIYQTANILTPEFVDNMTYLKRMNPGWKHKLYDDLACRQWIEEYCPKRVQKAYDKINPEYGPARSDLFRYCLLYYNGGVYLDIKSTITEPLDSVLFADDKYILSQWDQKEYPGAGYHKELGRRYREYQQWFIICEPCHPFLREVIECVLRNIDNYTPSQGVGKHGVLKLTGPIIYTQAINNIKHGKKYREVSNAELGLKYSIFKDTKIHHSSFFPRHYSTLTSPIVLE